MINARLKRNWLTGAGAFLLVSLLLAFAGNASAGPIRLKLASVVNGYGACSWTTNGDGTSTLRVTIDYKAGFFVEPATKFRSRGIMVYTYNKNGQMNPSGNAAKKVSLNGVGSYSPFNGDGYVMYHGWDLPQWKNQDPFIANVEVVIDDATVSDWPAISLRGGNYTDSDDVGEIAGGAYVSRSSIGSTCQVVDPVKPPPPPVTINVTAPDWNLGELPPGNSEKIFPLLADQLCFTYSGALVNGKTFIINASNANGLVNNRYRLRKIDDPTQEVPYSVKLDRATTTVYLPNVINSALSLDGAGKTCFVPTFTTTVNRGLKPGDYSDVLTFTIVKKS